MAIKMYAQQGHWKGFLKQDVVSAEDNMDGCSYAYSHNICITLRETNSPFKKEKRFKSNIPSVPSHYFHFAVIAFFVPLLLFHNLFFHMTIFALSSQFFDT